MNVELRLSSIRHPEAGWSHLSRAGYDDNIDRDVDFHVGLDIDPEVDPGADPDTGCQVRMLTSFFVFFSTVNGRRAVCIEGLAERFGCRSKLRCSRARPG